MSHFTHVETCFQNLFYLEKALQKLNINYEKHKRIIDNSKSYNTSLIISQPNNHNIGFIWNGQKYELITDMNFWEQSLSVKSFIGSISREYAGEVIIRESQKIGFQPVKYQQNSDGSNTLVLERWNSTNK